MSGWIRKTLKHQVLIIQPRFDKVADISLQICIDSNSNTNQNLGLTRFYTTPKGDYLGHHIGSVGTSLPKGALRCLYEDQVIEKIYQHVVISLKEQGFVGFAGIDMMLYRGANKKEILLHPLVEINPRLTMGHIALFLKKRIRSQGKLCFMSLEDVKKHPPVIESGQLIDGILQMTSDAPTVVCIMMQQIETSR
jgi:hypothetical protein